jgi:Fe-S oxidoreductase
MVALKYDRDVCLNCETVDCLTKCQHLRLDLPQAKEEKRRILDGRESFVLTDCHTCYACEEYCPNGNHPFSQIVELQERLGMLLAPKPILHQQVKMYSPAGKGELALPPEAAPLSLCLFPDMAKRVAGPHFEGASPFFGRDFFCNLVYLHFAKMSLIKERLPLVIENTARNMRNAGLEELVCFHDECYGGFTFLAPAYGMDVPFRSVHLYAYLAEKLKTLQHRISRLHARAAYQRPCSNRLIPETHGLVEEVFRLIGVDGVERRYDGQEALCCGSVLIMQGRDDLAEELQERNIRDMVDAGAQYCVFNCPMCFYTLGESVGKKGIRPVMMSDLCNLALDEGKERMGDRQDG